MRGNSMLKSVRNSSRNSMQVASQGQQSQPFAQVPIGQETIVSKDSKVGTFTSGVKAQEGEENDGVQLYFNTSKPTAIAASHRLTSVNLDSPNRQIERGDAVQQHNVYSSQPEPVSQTVEQSSATSSHKAVNSSSTGGSKPLFLQRILRV